MVETNSPTNESSPVYGLSIVLPSASKSELLLQQLSDVPDVHFVEHIPESGQSINLEPYDDPKLTELAMELGNAHRPSDKKTTLFLFTEGAHWQYRSQLSRQKTDLTVLEAVQKELTAEQLAPYWHTDALPSPESLSTIFTQHPAIADLYGRNPLSFQRDLKRIMHEYALKAQLDARTSNEMFAPRHGMLMNLLIRNRTFVECFPDQYFPIEPRAMDEALAKKYAEKYGQSLGDADLSTSSLESMRKTFENELPALRAAVGKRAKARLLEGMRQSLEQILREERVVPIDSRSPVYKVTFRVPPTQDDASTPAFSAIVKTFDVATGEKNNFENERAAITYFSRAKVLQNVHFTTVNLPEMHAVALNVINDEPLPQALEHLDPAQRGTLIEAIGREAAKLHAYAPFKLSRGNLSKDDWERHNFFAERITGEKSYFFGPLRFLLEQKRLLDAASLGNCEDKISRGLNPIFKRVADAKLYDTLCCDFRAENWFVRRKNGSWVCTKIDYENLRRAPAQMDLVFLPITDKNIWNDRHRFYDAYVRAYNAAAKDVNTKLVQPVTKDPQQRLLKLAKKDIHYYAESGINPLVPQLAYKAIEGIPSNSFKESVRNAIDASKRKLSEPNPTPLVRMAAEEYLSDIGTFVDNLQVPRPIIANERNFREYFHSFEFLRSLEQIGIYAGNILQHGMTQTRLDYIHTNFARVQELANVIGLQLKMKETQTFMKAVQSINALAHAAEKIS